MLKSSATRWAGASFVPTLLFVAATLCLLPLLVSSQESNTLDVQLVARNLGNPLDLTFIPGDTSGRRFVVEQDGRVLIMEPDNSVDSVTEPFFLDIRDRVLGLVYPFDERGLIGFAFHPNYQENGKVYARYTANRSLDENICTDSTGTVPAETPDGCLDQHASRLSEFTRSTTDPEVIDAATERILYEVENPSGRNIGAGLGFGPDGLLYTGFGDGGGIYGAPGGGFEGYLDASSGIPSALYFWDLNPQDLTSPYGKVMRFDVDTTTGDLPYGIPDTNPWANNDKGYLPEIYAWGFRNPYRLSFDKFFYGENAGTPADGFYPFWISASAETLFDASNLIDEPGNYGWPVKQGSYCFARANPLIPPEVVECTSNADCANVTVYNQEPLCGDNGFCSCTMTDAEGFVMKDPAIQYVNNNAAERPEAEALVEAGLIGQPLGRASLGGSIYRGEAIPWLFGKFANGDFAVEQLNGQVLIGTDPGDGSLPWPLERGLVLDKSDEIKAGFVKAIGEDERGELYIISGEFDEFGQIDGRIFLIIDSTVTDDSGAGTPDDPSDAANPDEPPQGGSTGEPSKASPRTLTSWLYLGVALFVIFIGY